MKKYNIILASIFVAFSASAQNCPEPQVNLMITKAEPMLDHTKTSAGLRQQRIEEGRKGAEGLKFFGVNRNVYKLTANFDIDQPVDENAPTACVKSVDMKLNVAPTVFIAKQIPQNSCIYKSTLNHELEHIKIANEAYDIAAIEAKKKIQTASTIQLKGSTADQGTAKERYRKFLDNITRYIISYGAQKQMNFDKAEHENMMILLNEKANQDPTTRAQKESQEKSTTDTGFMDDCTVEEFKKIHNELLD